MFSPASPTTPPPPAYSELFPDKSQISIHSLAKKAAGQIALVDAVADEKCARLFEEPCEIVQNSQLVLEPVHAPKKTERAVLHSWLWVSETRPLDLLTSSWLTREQMTLLVITTSIVMQLVVLPAISAVSSQDSLFHLVRPSSRGHDPVMTEVVQAC